MTKASDEAFPKLNPKDGVQSASLIVWDLFYDLEPVNRDDLVRAFADRLHSSPGVSGHVIRTYANHLRRLAERRGTDWDDTQVNPPDRFTWVSKAARFYVGKWLHGRRAADQVDQDTEGRWASTGNPPRFRDPDTGRLVPYTPDYSRQHRERVGREMREHARGMGNR